MRSFVSELRRRNVFKVAVVYGVVAWLLVQVASVTFPILLLPHWTVTLAAALVLLGFPIALILAWAFELTPQGIHRSSAPPGAAATSPRESAAPPPPESAFAAIAVLPFKNLTPSSPHAFIADAIAMELHNALSRVHELRVASRQSVIARATDRDAGSIARDLKVQYVISGTCAHVADEIQIMVQLDDALNDTMLWSERYETEARDLLSVQRNIAESIVQAFGGEKLRAEIRRVNDAATKDLKAWEQVQKARAYLLHYDAASIGKAVVLLEKAVELDREYAGAHAMLGLITAEKTLNGISEDAARDRAAAIESVERAETLAPHDPVVLRAAGAVYAYCGDYRRSLTLLRRAVALAPYDAGAWGYFGWPLVACGESSALVELDQILDRLMSTARNHPGHAYWLFHKCVAYSCANQCERAADYAQQSTAEQPRFALAWMNYANILGRLEQLDASRAAAAQCARVNANMTADYYAELMSVLSDRPEVIESRTVGLRRAGLLQALPSAGTAPPTSL